MNVQDAAHLLAHNYPGGAGLLADRMGINRAVFNSKTNPNTTTHHLTLVEAVRMQQLAESFGILHAMADTLGFVAIRKPQLTDEGLTLNITRACAEFGEFMQQVNATLADGRVTSTEIKQVQKELTEHIAAATALAGALSAMVPSAPDEATL